MVPDIVRETLDIDAKVMAITNVADEVEMEAFSSNVDDDKWSQELQNSEQDFPDDNWEAHNDTKRCANQSKTSISLTYNDIECILLLLRTTKDCNKKLQGHTERHELVESRK